MGAGNIGRVHHINTITLMNNVSAASNYTSASININDFVLYSIQFSWATFSGTSQSISTEGSNDGTIWTAVDTFIPSGSSGSRLLNVEKAGYAYVRVVYTRTTGAGTIKAVLNGKVD